MKNIIVSTYKNLGDSETVAFAHRVVEKMENNPTFPDAPAALGALKKLVPELLSAVANARGRDIEAVAFKNSRKAELIALLIELAAYVTLTCKEDRLKLLSSGFLISGGNCNEPDAVITQLEVELGPPGEATVSVKRVRAAFDGEILVPGCCYRPIRRNYYFSGSCKGHSVNRATMPTADY
jgi:hypothetical protein